MSTVLGSKFAIAAIAVGALAIGGAGIAYATTDLGGDTVVEPTSTPVPTETADDESGNTETDGMDETTVGPDATGAAAFGLCNAYLHGGLSSNSTAYASLEAAALTAALNAPAVTTTTTDDTTSTDTETTDPVTDVPTETPVLTTDDIIKAYCGTVAKPGSGHGNGNSGKDAANSHKPGNTGSQKDKTTHGKSGQAHGKGAHSSDD